MQCRDLFASPRRHRHVFPAEAIIETIWGGYGEGDQILLKNVVYRLRKKIEADPAHPLLLQTWPGAIRSGTKQMGRCNLS